MNIQGPGPLEEHVLLQNSTRDKQGLKEIKFVNGK